MNLIFALSMLLASPNSGIAAAEQESKQTGIHRPVSSGEIEELKRQILEEKSSSAEGILEYHSETGDLNNRLDFWRYGGRLNLKASAATLVYFSAASTSYLTLDGDLNQSGTSFTAGVRSRRSDQLSFRLEAGATTFSTDTKTVHALAWFDFKASPKSSIYATASRRNVEETLLSAVGIRPQTGPFAGGLVGRVMDNRFSLGARYQLSPQFDAFAEGGAGTRGGSNVDSNFFKRARVGSGYSLIATSEDEPVSLLRASYALDYFGYEKNLLGFGGVSLLASGGDRVQPSRIGSDGISPIATASEPGVGGYFSPQSFLSHVFRVEMQGRLEQHLKYQISGFIGSQSFTGSTARSAGGFAGGVTVPLTDRLSLPVTYLIDNFGPFTQQSLLVRLVLRF